MGTLSRKAFPEQVLGAGRKFRSVQRRGVWRACLEHFSRRWPSPGVHRPLRALPWGGGALGGGAWSKLSARTPRMRGLGATRPGLPDTSFVECYGADWGRQAQDRDHRRAAYPEWSSWWGRAARFAKAARCVGPGYPNPSPETTLKVRIFVWRQHRAPETKHSSSPDDSASCGPQDAMWEHLRTTPLLSNCRAPVSNIDRVWPKVAQFWPTSDHHRWSDVAEVGLIWANRRQVGPPAPGNCSKKAPAKIGRSLSPASQLPSRGPSGGE